MADMVDMPKFSILLRSFFFVSCHLKILSDLRLGTPNLEKQLKTGAFAPLAKSLYDFIIAKQNERRI